MVTETGKTNGETTTRTMDRDAQLLSFRLDEQEYALDIANVVEVVRMVAITPVPGAAGSIAGMINLRGNVIPVINIRRRFGLPDRPYDLNDHLLIARTNGRVMGLIVDRVSEVLTMPASNLQPALEVGPQRAAYISQVGRLGDRLLLILDLDALLSLKEERYLNGVLGREGTAATLYGPSDGSTRGGNDHREGTQ